MRTRTFFCQKYKFLGFIPGNILCFFFGIPPGFYYLHHVMMHHAENNIFPHDISSTMPHQRDSWSGFFHYVSKYFTHAILYLPYYAYKKKRYPLMAAHICCSVTYFFGGLYLFSLNPSLALWMIYIPFPVVGFALMHGNYSQHIFVCPNDPFETYRLAFNYVNSPGNQRNYNDGYHLVHHITSRLHWTQAPQYFEDNIEKFAQKDSFLFKEIDFPDVFDLVYAQNYEKLYDHWVQLDPENIRTAKQFEEECRSRLKPNHKTKKLA
mmetsp:Transcript_4763/g.8578  ORF Transcript_4763/g.8578 Transcript_4763/m.8578 type:complete len:265 (-) Transcript_4763:2940-3734(-)